MSDSDLIKVILQNAKERYDAKLSDADAFEYFCAETILKPFNLTFNQIQDGIVDGQNDGGIDSVYFFANRSLVSIDTKLDSFKSPVTIDLYVIQSKFKTSISENTIAKLKASIPELIEFSGKEAKLTIRYNNFVCEVFRSYRRCLKKLIVQFPTIQIHVFYVTIANGMNAKAQEMIPDLEKLIGEKHAKSTCKVEIWGAARLYEAAKEQSVMIKELPFVKQPISHGKGYVILSKIRDYYDFINCNGSIIDSLFEFNVRDYQSSSAVNKEIAATLANEDDKNDFWWLNNGITILAKNVSSQDNKLTIQNPIVVNGLQTSHEIHRFFSAGNLPKIERCVQVRVLEIDDESRRDRVIKATNSHTGIKSSSLHAIEPFQRKIEEFLFQIDIFYDRRKDYWRNKNKPANKIIGIDKMAQSIIAIVLERPHDARARPTTIIKDDKLYPKMFAEATELEMYQVCANIYFRVDEYFKSNVDTISSTFRNNLRYHVMMQLSWTLNNSRPVHASALRSLKVSKVTDGDIKEILEHTGNLFNEFGPEDKTAKSKEFTALLQKKSLV